MLTKEERLKKKNFLDSVLALPIDRAIEDLVVVIELRTALRKRLLQAIRDNDNFWSTPYLTLPRISEEAKWRRKVNRYSSEIGDKKLIELVRGLKMDNTKEN